MHGKWQQIPLGEQVQNPEADWLSELPVDRGPCPVSVRLSRDAALYVITGYARRHGVGGALPGVSGEADSPLPELQVLLEHLLLGQDMFSALIDFHNDKTGPDAIHVIAVVDASGLEVLKTLSSTNPHCRLTDIGLGLPSDAYTTGRIVAPDQVPGQQEPTDLDGSEVIVATIDDGIGFANTRFRLTPTATRIEYFWDMRAPPIDRNNIEALFGRVLRKREIDGLLAQVPDDDEALYRRAACLEPDDDRRQGVKFRTTHGTHVLDVAAGYDFDVPEERAIAAKRPIIAVQLPSEVIAERSDAFTAQWLKFALSKIRHQAMELANRIALARHRSEIKYLPIVVNFSFGAFAGPHDGESAIERTIQAFIESYRNLPGHPPCEVVIPVGNGFQSKAIAQFKAGDIADVAELPWRILPDDKTSSFVQVWLPPSGETAQQIAVSLVPPFGDPATVPWSCLDHAVQWVVDKGVVARLYHQKVRRPDGRHRERVVIAVCGTESDDDSDVRAPVGLWTIRIRNLRLAGDAVVDLRIQRDDSLMGQRPTGRQSYFDHPLYATYEEPSGRIRNDSEGEAGPVTRKGTYNSYATGLKAVVVGGYRRADGAPAIYSGSGSNFSGRPGPTLSAVSDESRAVSGILASGTYSGSVFRQNGTSVSAPAVTRALADVIASDPTIACDGAIQRLLDGIGGNYQGPQERYRPVEAARQGRGRLIPTEPPAHRSHFQDPVARLP